MSYLPPALKCDSDCSKTTLTKNGNPSYKVYWYWTGQSNTKNIKIEEVNETDSETKFEGEKHACSPECAGKIVTFMLKEKK